MNKNSTPTPTTLTPNFSEAEKFLSLFDGLITFQTFDDSGQRKELARHTSSPLEKIRESISRLNNAGAGVFFMVNEGDGKGRKNANVVRVRALFIDIDKPGEEGDPESLVRQVLRQCGECGVEPSVVVESSARKFHCYWLVREGSCSVEEFSGMQVALARKFREFGADPSVKDPARVMRVPGFWHMKHAESPFLVKVHGEINPVVYDARNLVKALGLEVRGSGEGGMADIHTGYGSGAEGGSGSERVRRGLGGESEGNRNVGLFRYGCSLRAKRLAVDEIEALMLEKAGSCNPPLAVSEVSVILSQVLKYEEGVDKDTAKKLKQQRRQKEAKAIAEKVKQKIEQADTDPQAGLYLGAAGETGSCGGASPEPFSETEFDFAKATPYLYHQKHNAWTDSGAAEFFIHMHGEGLRVTEDDRLWIWNGKIWLEDPQEDVSRAKVASLAPYYRKLAAEYIRRHVRSGLKGEPREHVKCLNFVEELGNTRRQSSVLRAVRGYSSCRCKVDDFDARPELINLQNGVLNLDTFELLPHSGALMCSRIANASWDTSEQECPIFDQFVDDIMCGDRELISYKLRQWGYILSGHTSQRAVFLHIGAGTNGKTKEADLLRWLMGSYATEVPNSIYMSSNYDSERNYALAELPGIRLAISGEVGGNRSWDEEVLKQLTGDEGSIRARKIRQSAITFKPRFKPLIHGNSKPIIRNGQAAIWSRLHIIPYNFYADESKRDLNLLEKLKLEGDAIFRRMACGYREFRALGGLFPPKSVVDEVSEYKASEMSDFQDFVDDRCQVSPDFSVRFSDLYAAYSEFVRKRGVKQKSKESLSKWLSERGFESCRKTSGTKFKSGIKLRAESDFEDDCGLF